VSTLALTKTSGERFLNGEDSLAHTVDGRMAGDHLQFWHVLSLPTPRRGRYVSNWDDASV